MEPSSEYSLPISSQKRDSCLSAPSNAQATLMHLDGEDDQKHEDVPQSYFSEEEDDNSSLHSAQSHDSKTQGTDILKLADREDPLKVSRITLVHRITTFKNLSTLGEIIPEEDHPRSSSIEHELPLPEEMSNLTSIADSLSGFESFTTKQTNSKDSSIILESHSKEVESPLPKELHLKQKAQSQGAAKLDKKPIKEPCKVEQKGALQVVQGFLRKRSPNFLHMWQVRYVVLKDRKLLYYKNESMDKLLGCLDFDLFASQLKIDGKSRKEFIIAPTGSDRKFTWKAGSEEERRKWTNALAEHIEASAGVKMNIAPKKHFWKHDRLSETKFLAEAKTGDLLLFRTQNLAAKFQRSVTRSEYDHVGLILKNHDGSLVLFEATGGEGVGLCRWSAFKQHSWHLLYKKVVYRKLIVERTRDLIDKAEKFVKSTVGKKYSVTPQKLLQRKSTSIAIDTPQDRTFFCSELVAACYKRMGLLPNTISSSQYLPGTFAAYKKLALVGDAKLGEEYLIDFNLSG